MHSGLTRKAPSLRVLPGNYYAASVLAAQWTEIMFSASFSEWSVSKIAATSYKQEKITPVRG